MPNFWTNTTQVLYEKFKGPRTKDLEYEAIFEQIKAFDKHSNHLKTLFTNFQKNTLEFNYKKLKIFFTEHLKNLGMKNYFKDFTSLIPPLYENNSPITVHVLEITKYHSEIETYFDYMCNEVVSIGSKISELAKYNEEMTGYHKQWENLRRIYDWYDEKLGKLVRIREEKAFKKTQESEKEIKKFDRNQEKYKKATKDYVSISMYSYKKMNDYLDIGYDLVNTAVMKLLEEEKKFFAYCWERMNRIEYLKSTIQSISSNYTRQSDNYNPLRYVRGSKLIDESFIYSNFPELNFSKNLKEWKENQKNGKKNVMNFEDYLSKAKAEIQNAQAKNNFCNWKNGNINSNNASNPNSTKNSSQNVSIHAPNYRFSQDNFSQQSSQNSHINTANNENFAGKSDGNFYNSVPMKDNNSYQNNFSGNVNINNNTTSESSDKQLNYSFPGNQPAPLVSPYENVSLQNLNLNSNQGVQAGYSCQKGFGINGNSSFSQYPNYQFDNKITNNLNNTFPSANVGNFNLNDFYNVNNLNFPK